MTAVQANYASDRRWCCKGGLALDTVAPLQRCQARKPLCCIKHEASRGGCTAALPYEKAL